MNAIRCTAMLLGLLGVAWLPSAMGQQIIVYYPPAVAPLVTTPVT